MTWLRTMLPAALLALAACATLPQPYQANPGTLALPAVVVYQDSTGPLSYQAPVLPPSGTLDGSAQVEGRACQSGIQIPIGFLTSWRENNGDQAAAVSTLSAGWGEGGFQAAMADAASKAPPGALLYDVRADLNVVMVLGIWREQCLVVTARAASPTGARPTVDSQ